MNVIPQRVRDAFERLLDPPATILIRYHVRPNIITTVGTLIVIASATAFAVGWVHAGGFLLLFSGLFDMVDGRVARRGGMATTFGAFYDSTLDRVGDGATFIGIAVFLLTAPDVAWRLPAVILCMVAILASLLVSYARARAEGLGLDCKVGIAQRAERILGLGLISLICGASARAQVLEGVVALLAIASIVTVIQRFVYVYRAAVAAEPGRGAPAEVRALDPLSKGR